MGNSTLVGLLMIAGGMMLVSGGVFVMNRRPPGPQVSLAAMADGVAAPESEAPVAASIPPSKATAVGIEAAPSSEEKGEAFEKWVVRKFNRDYFTIQDWRSDKTVDGIYAQSSKNPDLEIELRLKDAWATFAVECKWRKGFQQGEKPVIQWATERQIHTYRQFSRDRAIPVFVVIGIGGEPDNPAELYVVPLDQLKYPYATAEYLARFQRRTIDSDFFYDIKKPELR
jgi:hypothetical protein